MPKTKKKTSTSSRASNKQHKSNPKTAEIVSICLAAVSIILFVCVYTQSDGWLVSAVSTIMRGLFGVGAYILPIAVIGSVVYYFASKAEDKKRKYICTYIYGFSSEEF